MPATLTLRADSVCRDDTGETVHIEWQGRNDAKMAARMLQYAAWLLNDEGRFPLQYVFYVGAAEMSMPTTVVSEGRIVYSYNLLNIADLDAEPLLASPDVRDNIDLGNGGRLGREAVSSHGRSCATRGPSACGADAAG